MDDFKVVEPDEPTDALEEVCAVFVKKGVPDADARLIARCVVRDDFFVGGFPAADIERAGVSDHVRRLAGYAAESFERHGCQRDGALVTLLNHLLFGWYHSPGLGDKIQRLTSEDAPVAWVLEWLLEFGIDWRVGVLAIVDQDKCIPRWSFFSLLETHLPEEHRTYFPAVLDLTLYRQGDGAHGLDTDRDSAKSVCFWLRLLGQGAGAGSTKEFLRRLYPLLVDEPDGSVGVLAKSVGEKLESIIRGEVSQAPKGQERAAFYGNKWNHELHSSLKPYFADLDRRRVRASDDMELRRAWYYYGYLCAQVQGLLPQDRLHDLKRTAQRELGLLRKHARQAGEKDHDDSTQWDLYRWAVRVMRTVGSPWTALKPLLLALSALQMPAVADDLRYFDLDEDVPRPWYEIPDQIGLIFLSLDEELSTDPGLSKLRTEFALFCLERLKTKKGARHGAEHRLEDSDFVEDRRQWRYFYIRALRELCINPKGRGHHVLFWVSENDPHQRIRDMARTAYKEVRHESVLPEGEKAEIRALVRAFWWLRQAHLSCLPEPVEIDDNAAKRTLNKEYRRLLKK